MSSQQKSSPQSHRLTRMACLCLVSLAACATTGCQDGPLYAMKAANPFYSMGEWKRDQAIGVTDHQRHKELALLAETIDELPANRQQFWSGHLLKMIENDTSPEMRRLAIRAAGRINDPSALAMIDKGLDDESMKVRMEACEALGRRKGTEAAQMLAATMGTESNEDVKHAAIKALANHKGQVAVDKLKLALKDRNPATRDLAVESLRGVTGKNYGDDPSAWIAALEGKPTPEAETRIADRVRNLF